MNAVAGDTFDPPEAPNQGIGNLAYLRQALERPAPKPPAPLTDKRIDWEDLSVKSPPERQWAIKGWLGMGHVTLIAGPPGSGKTAVCQTIASALSQGYEIIDEVPKPRTVLFWAGEDDRDELWRRQVAIAQWMGVPLADFADRLHILPLDQEDLSLVARTQDGLQPTPRLTELREQIGDYKADVVFLDSVARTFGGNENDRHDVTQFIAGLQWACAPTNAALGLIGHPAKAIGSEFSGSTAWEASVRARLFFGFQMPDAKVDPENPPDPVSPLRYLAKRKTNYSVRDFRVVKYMNGVMAPQTPEPGQVRNTTRHPAFLADEVIHLLRKLTLMGIAASHQPNSPGYLPRVAKAAGLVSDSLTERDIRAGLAECLKTSRVRVDTVGHYPNRTPKKGLVEVVR